MINKKQCSICSGFYLGADLYYHSCSQCWNCGRPFELHPNPEKKKTVKRYNELDRFKAFHNTCESCGKRQNGQKQSKKKKNGLEKWI